MRTSISFLTMAALAGVLVSGCATHNKVETKFSRGVNNTFELVRMGEFRRSMEQTAVFHGHDASFSGGFIRGVNRSLARTGIGIYEMVTAPFPPYEPKYTAHFSPAPVYPDNYTPTMMADSMFATDGRLGFAGGDIAPMIPGSRFHIFENP